MLAAGLILCCLIAAVLPHCFVGLLPPSALPRTTRVEVLRGKTLPYVEAANLVRAGPLRILLRDVLPNLWGPAVVLATLKFGAAIPATAAPAFWVWRRDAAELGAKAAAVQNGPYPNSLTVIPSAQVHIAETPNYIWKCRQN